jgi:hypothetical protein
MDTKELHKLLNDYDQNLCIESIDNDMLIISPNEYLTLYATEANEMLDINGSGIHWHMETEEMAGFIIAILKGNSIIIEIRSIFVKVIDIPSRYKILSKEKYEKIKHHYIGKKRVRIYSGNLIIQRAD